jgi:tRNA G18 (ribose-2'-O)-methylase SpoU
MGLTAIERADDARLSGYRALNDADLRRSIEEGEGVLIVEGVTAVAKLLGSPVQARSILTLSSKAAAVAELVAGSAQSTTEVLSVERQLMAEIVGFDLHRGVVALAERPASTPLAALASLHTLVVLEGLNDQENLGAIGRSARALGADGFVLDRRCADPYYRRAVRVSMGELLMLPIARVDDAGEALVTLGAAGFTTLAMTPSGELEIDEIHRRPGDRFALAFGAEGPGLAATTLQAARHRVRIPVAPAVDSLNVGHAAAIALHLVRHRTNR